MERKIRVQWTLTPAAYEWFVRLSDAIGTAPSRLADRMIRYHAGQLPEDQFDIFEELISAVGEQVAGQVEWSDEDE